MSFRVLPPVVDLRTGRKVAPAMLPGFRLARARSYRSRMGIGGLGQFDQSTLDAKRAELAKVRQERESVEAELARLKSGSPPAPVATTVPAGTAVPAGAAVPTRPAKPPAIQQRREQRRVPTWAIVGAAGVSLFALKGLLK